MISQLLLGSFEEKKALVGRFNLKDDIFFGNVMEDKEACEEALQILTGISDLKVIEVKSQYSIRNLGTHSVILDVLAEDSSHKLYNMELQQADNDNHLKRARYYQANIDISFLDKGKKYDALPELYIIYISSFDIFKKNKPLYVINQTVYGTDIVIDDGTHKIYANMEANDNSLVANLMQYFKQTDLQNKKFEKISKRVHYFKENMEGVEHMCELMETIKFEGKLEGKLEEQMRGIKALIESLSKYNVGTQAIAQELIDKFSLSAEDASKLVKQYAPH